MGCGCLRSPSLFGGHGYVPSQGPDAGPRVLDGASTVLVSPRGRGSGHGLLCVLRRGAGRTPLLYLKGHSDPSAFCPAPRRGPRWGQATLVNTSRLESEMWFSQTALGSGPPARRPGCSMRCRQARLGGRPCAWVTGPRRTWVGGDPRWRETAWFAGGREDHSVGLLHGKKQKETIVSMSGRHGKTWRGSVTVASLT